MNGKMTKYIGGEKIWTRNLSRHFLASYEEYVRRITNRGYFYETANRKDGVAVIINCGDNCLRFTEATR